VSPQAVAHLAERLPTLHRDDETTDLDNFTDDKGTGSVTFHKEMFMVGKKWLTTDCSGSGKSELHEVVVNEEANTYSIDAIGPGCSGETVDHVNGNTGPFGPDFSSITINNQPLVNKNLLAGSKSTTTEVPPGLGTVTTTITWSLQRSITPDVELIITPEDYDIWLPEPGRNERTAGTFMKVSLKLRGVNGTTTTKKAKSFELRLSNTSTEPGMTINFPVNSTNTSPDLRFMPQVNAVILDTTSQTMKIICQPSSQTGEFKVGSFDGGGWTVLNAEAILDDNTRVLGRFLVSNGETDIRIPKRDLNSKIATIWLTSNGNLNEMDDQEMSKGNNYRGDGLTAYEEYRGVVSEGRFRRLNPKKKELGVDVLKSELSFFSEGIKLFENATGLTAILFHEDENEIDLDRRINKNSSTNHDYDQYALRLYKSEIPKKGIMGKAYGGPGTPAKTYAVIIDNPEIQNLYSYWEIYARTNNMQMPFTIKEFTSAITAHELGHGVNCWHHGRTQEGPEGIALADSNPAFHIFSNNRGQINEITLRPYPLEGDIGKVGNQQSGDLSCFMVYNPNCEWAYRMDGGEHFYYMVPLLPLSNSLCISGTGTSINATPNYFGNGFRGNCLAQVKLRD
jgi:hypothetical protein